MLDHHSVNISDVTKDHFFSIKETFDAKDGFQIAVALVANGNFEIEDFYEYNIFRIAHGTEDDERHKFEIHHCDERELLQIKYGFAGAFYPLKDSFASEFEKISPFLMCIDNSLITLQGNEDEKIYQNFFVEIDVNPDYCDPMKHYYCNPTSNFKQVTQEVGFYTVTNQRRFQPQRYDYYPFVDESVITYYADVNTSTKQVQRVVRRHLEDDINLFLSIPGWTDKTQEFFEMQPYRSYKEHTSYTSKLTIEVELEMDMFKTTRTVMTIIDVLGQAGGIYGILITVAMIISRSALRKRPLWSLIRRLCIGMSNNVRRLETFQNLNHERTNLCTNIFKSLCCTCCVCKSCKDGVTETYFEEGEYFLTQEMCIVDILGDIRKY